MITVKGLTKIYKSKKNTIKANDNISLNITKGELVCILGQNGAGKTTLIKSICGLIIPTEGEIYIDSENIIKNPEIPRNKIGVVLEGSRNIYYYLSPKENLMYFGLLNNIPVKTIKKRTEELLTMFNLKDRENDMVKNFSRGMQQKVAIMVALLKDPEILILDEPTLGLDIFAANMIKQIIRDLTVNHKKTILITTHDVNLIENLRSRVIFIKDGRIIKDDMLDNLKFILEPKQLYEVVLENNNYTKSIQFTSQEGINYTLEKKNDELLTIRTGNFEWLAHNMNKINIKQIKMVEPGFEEIYKNILEGVI